METVHIDAVFALASALCVALGDVLQQRAAHQTADSAAGRIQLWAQLLRDQRWQWGAVLLLASIGLEAAALQHGSVLVVQPLLTFSLLFALVINARLSNRRLSDREWVWGSLLTAAVIVVVTVGNPQGGRIDASPHAWAAVAVVLGPLLAGCVVAARLWGGIWAAALLAFVSGSLWGVFAVLTKQVVALPAGGGWALAGGPQLYALLLVALGGFFWGQAAFRAGPLTASMPILQVTQPVVAAVLGIVVLHETLLTDGARMAAWAAAALIMAAAIVQLARIDAVAAPPAPAPRRTAIGAPRSLPEWADHLPAPGHPARVEAAETIAAYFV